jgi:uncharacterized protein with von Willebrand factor type A (vWA) domain
MPRDGKNQPPAPRMKGTVVPEKGEADTRQEISFLGSSGTGKRFCIIADNSGSMRFRLDTVKLELAKTLKSLNATSQFHVMFFNSRPMPQPGEGWLHGERDVAKIAPWIVAMPAGGGTEPTPAFELALKLKPRPDVIFFMTDGFIPRRVPDEVARLNNEKPKVVIHTILIGSPKALEESLQRIAKDSGGTFRAVAVNGIGGPPKK